jgi:hypothetical protein
MLKTIKLILILMIINVINSQIIALNNGRSWLYPCSVNKCLEPIQRCIEKKCIGEGQCFHCLIKENFKCESCSKEIFDENNLEKGELICLVNDPLQEKVCQLYCRGKYQNVGKCERNQQQIPRCLCENEKEETTTLKTTTVVTEIPKTTTVQINENPQCKYILFLF